ncbi:MAG: SWIM zinc finger family protein, partial [Ginsengibacter sp.]
MVTSININENTIKAKVTGSRPKPYDITIVVPPLFEEEQNILVENIRNNPLLLSQLLNRQLPHELLSLAESKGIKIFPKSWQDIKLNCSCPDWAVPCKHLAAVIYIIANEIDQNPFLVFNLHRFNVLEAISESKMKLEDLKREKIFSFENCIADVNHENLKQDLKEDKQKEIPDFSLIENLLPTLPLLFTANPLFFDKDFKPVIQNNYKQLSRYQPKYISQLKSQELRLTNDYRYYNYSFVFDEAANAEIKTIDSDLNEYKISFNDLIVLLATTESKHLESYSPSFIFLYQSFHFCNVLAERGALLPRLFFAGKDKYKIQWIPALLNASVKKVFDDLLKWYPDKLVLLDIKTTGKKETTKIKFKNATRQEAQTLICSLFANTVVHDCYSTIWRQSKSSKEKDSKIMELFFGDSLQEFKSFSEKEIPNTIQLWLNRFYLSKKDFSPVLQVHEQEDQEGFEVEVLMKDNVAPMQPVEPLYAFMDANSDKQFSALKDVQLLSHYMPGLDEIIASKGMKKLH